MSLLALPLKKEESKAKGKEPKKESKTAVSQDEEMSKAEKAMKAHSDKLLKIRSSLAKVYNPLLKQVLAHNDVDSAGGGSHTATATCRHHAARRAKHVSAVQDGQAIVRRW